MKKLERNAHCIREQGSCFLKSGPDLGGEGPPTVKVIPDLSSFIWLRELGKVPKSRATRTYNKEGGLKIRRVSATAGAERWATVLQLRRLRT